MLKEGKIRIWEKKVFEDYFRSHYQTFCYFAYHLLKDQQEAEDVVQEIFIRLLDSKTYFDNEEHLKNYFYKSVRNACLNRIKSTKTHSELSNEVSENDFFTNIVRAEVYEEIMRAIYKLPKGCRQIFQLAYIDGYSNEEIAAQLFISVNTVKVQKNKAKKQLQEQLKNLYPLLFFLFRCAIASTL